MDLLPLGFLFLIVAVAGVIGYAADNLGKKLGKKRLSLFGLRPKHTAMLGTIALGIFTSLFTIILLAALSSGVRRWITEGSNAIVQRDKLRQEVDDARRQREGQQKKIDQLDRQIRDKTQNLSVQKANLAKQVGEISRLTSRRKELEAKVSRFSGQIRRVEASLSASQGQLKTLQSRQRTLLVQNDGLTKQNKRIGKEKTDARAQLGESLKEKLLLDQANQELSKQIAAQKAEVDGLISQRTSLEAAKAEAERDLKASQESLSQNRRLLEETSRLLDAAKRQLDQAELANSFLASTFTSSRYQPMTFRFGEELTRLSLRADLSREEVQSNLTTLLRMARVSAGLRGAKGHRTDEKSYELADIYDRRDPKTQTLVTAEEYKSELVRQASKLKTEQVLIAFAGLNSFQGEPVSLEIGLLPNPLIYIRGALIAETKIDGNKPEVALLQDITRFLVDKVSQQAKRDKMIPKAKSDEPFGAVETETILDLIRQAKSAGRVLRLEAIAAKDTHAADSLKLEFRLK